MSDRPENDRNAREQDARRPQRPRRPRLGVTPLEERLSLPERALRHIRRRATAAEPATDAESMEVDRGP